jgi:uncharacterized protein with PIN domain
MNIGKCPYCHGSVNDVILESVTAKVNPATGSGGPYNGVICLCPSCQSVLSVSIDPKALEMKRKA